MSAVKWSPPTREYDMRAQVEAHRAAMAAGPPKGGWPKRRNVLDQMEEVIPEAPPEPVGPDGTHARERCSCRRLVPVFELVDARAVPEHAGDWACGACREGHARAGRITIEEWMRRLGAPAAVLTRLRLVDERIGARKS